MAEIETKIPLNQKRLLGIEEFCLYVSLGKNRARELAAASGCEFRVGKRLLIDWVKFDSWCDANV